MPLSDLHKKKSKKNWLILAIIFGLVALIWAVTIIKIDRANAADVQSCPAAISSEMSAEASSPICDIYTRSISFREEAVLLDENMKQRAENFAAPRRAAKKAFDSDLENLHRSVTAID